MRGRAPGRGPRRPAATARRRRPSASASSSSVAGVDVAALRRPPSSIGLVGIVAALAEVLRLDVADVQEAVAADAEIDERRLDARLDVDDLSLVDVADVVVLAGPFDVELFEDSVFDDRDPAFLRLRTLINISCFIGRAFSVRQGKGTTKAATEASGRVIGPTPRAVRVNVPPGMFEVVEPQSGQHFARASAALPIDPQPHPQHAIGQRQLLRSAAADPAGAARPSRSIGYDAWASSQIDALGCRGLPLGQARGVSKSTPTACALPSSRGHHFDMSQRQARAASAAPSAACNCSAVHGEPTTRFPPTRPARRFPRPGPRGNSSAAWGGTLGHAQRHFRPAEQALPSAHQIAVAEPAQIILLGETNSDALSDHRFNSAGAAVAPAGLSPSSDQEKNLVLCHSSNLRCHWLCQRLLGRANKARI